MSRLFGVEIMINSRPLLIERAHNSSYIGKQILNEQAMLLLAFKASKPEFCCYNKDVRREYIKNGDLGVA